MQVAADTVSCLNSHTGLMDVPLDETAVLCACGSRRSCLNSHTGLMDVPLGETAVLCTCGSRHSCLNSHTGLMDIPLDESTETGVLHAGGSRYS